MQQEWSEFIYVLRYLLDDDFGLSKLLEKSKGINYEDIPEKTEFKLAIKKGQYETTKTEGTRVIKLLHIIKIYSKDPRVKTLIKEMKIAA